MNANSSVTKHFDLRVTITDIIMKFVSRQKLTLKDYAAKTLFTVNDKYK